MNQTKKTRPAAIFSLPTLALAAVVLLEAAGMQALSHGPDRRTIAADDTIYTETAQAPVDARATARTRIASR